MQSVHVVKCSKAYSSAKSPAVRAQQLARDKKNRGRLHTRSENFTHAAARRAEATVRRPPEVWDCPQCWSLAWQGQGQGAVENAAGDRHPQLLRTGTRQPRPSGLQLRNTRDAYSSANWRIVSRSHPPTPTPTLPASPPSSALAASTPTQSLPASPSSSSWAASPRSRPPTLYPVRRNR